MKLNPDCIRDVMLVLEDRLSFNNINGAFSFESMYLEKLTLIMNKMGYSEEEIAYSVLQLLESKYIVSSRNDPVDDKRRWLDIGNILYITPTGHDFISSVHDQETWKIKINPILNAVGNVSLSIIESVSKGVANAALDRLMLNPPVNTP